MKKGLRRATVHTILFGLKVKLGNQSSAASYPAPGTWKGWNLSFLFSWERFREDERH